MKILLINPTQLFANIKHLKDFDKIIIYEEPKFFIQFKYHKQKLILHRASCMWYYDWLKENKYKVEYIEYHEKPPKVTHIYEPYDHDLSSKYKNCEKIDNPNFLISPELIEQNKKIFFNGNKFSHEKFYKWQRRRLNILMKGQMPQGNKWSFDTENRQKIPANEKIPELPKVNKNKYIHDAINYISKNFSNNPGEINFIWPISHKEANEWLNNFVKYRFKNFGKYEDASQKGQPILFHSALTSSLNIGLITDQDVVQACLKVNVPLSSKEGFIRQLIGWRNYMLAIYMIKGEQLMKMNHWGYKKKIPKSWWYGNSGIEPFDDIVQNKILKYAFTHHIERLMYLGVWMFLNQISPKEVYKWFMEMTIDAYEWVMVPNIFGMSQNADGGIVMKRFYICSSNYILKMSNYKRNEWCNILDAVYYSFINRNLERLERNYFYSPQVTNWKKKSPKEKKELLDLAKKYQSK